MIARRPITKGRMASKISAIPSCSATSRAWASPARLQRNSLSPASARCLIFWITETLGISFDPLHLTKVSSASTYTTIVPFAPVKFVKDSAMLVLQTVYI